MSCSECHGLPNCPICGDEPKTYTAVCGECKGAGKFYISTVDDSEISAGQYAELPECTKARYEVVDCIECNGTGEMELELEIPDIMDYYHQKMDF